MEDVQLPSTLKQIEYNAFTECKNLKKIRLPDGLEMIGKWGFAKSGLTELVLPRSVRTVGAYAFHECKHLRSIHLNEGLEKLGAKEVIKGQSVVG